MQNQKTMAKWLAIALLLMVAVACYVALNAILKKDKSSTDTTASADESAKEQTVETIKPSEPVHIPVYSSFPRRAEKVGSTLVSHVGGENDDSYLNHFCIEEKTILLFSTSSTEYDVKESGIYLAMFSGDYLISTILLANGDEKYLSSTVTKSGILLATQTNSKTIFRLLSQSGDIVAKSETMPYSCVFLTPDGQTNDVICFGTDESFVYRFSLDDKLAVTRSNFVYSLPYANIKTVVGFGAYKLLFVQNEQCLEIVSFSQNTGFNRKNRLINSAFVQILPSAENSSSAFTLLTSKQIESEKSLLLSGFDASGNILSSYLINDTSNGVLKQEGEQILLFTQHEIYQFCSHLELVSKSQYSADDSPFVAPVLCNNIDGTDLFVRTDGITFQIVDKTSTMLFSAKGKNVLAESFSSQSAQNQKLRLIFEAKANDSLSYMAFGGYDILIVDAIAP